MFDTHLHTEFSTDSTMTISEAVDMSKKQNLGIILTEHIDLNYKDKTKFRFDVNEYFGRYNTFRNNNLLLGVEIGMCNKFSSKYKDIINNYSFDYVIGSLHEMYDIDLYEADKLYEKMSKKELYNDYFERIIKCIDQHNFIDSLGHIDYISRCAKYEDTEIYYDDYRDIIDELLKKIIDKGISLELNTRRLVDKDSVDNLLKIYKRFYELGGRYVTVGSDAHNSFSIGKNFNTAKDILEFCSLKSIYYKNRKPVYN